MPARRSIPRMLITACAAALAACSTPEARFSTIAELPEDLRDSVLLEVFGTEGENAWAVQVAIDQRLEGDLPDRPLLIPFTDERPWEKPGQRGRPVVTTRIWPLGGGPPMTVPAVVDTGAGSTLILSLDTAHDVDVWLSAEIGPHDGIGFVGPVASGEGLVRRLEIGPITLAPAEVKVNTEQRGRSASLGLSAFLAFGGLVFDWENHVIVALPRGRPIRVDPGWAAMTWTPVPETSLTPVVAEPSDESGGVRDTTAWQVRSQFRAMPVVQAAIAGRSLRTVLDTGGDGDLASLRPLPVEGDGRPRMVASHGRLQRMREHVLDGGVRLGTVLYESPTVVVPDPARAGNQDESQASLQFFDAVIGVELLRRHPLWFDFERGVVRLWTGEGPLPALAGSRGQRGDTQ